MPNINLDGMVFGLPPRTHVSDNVMLNSMPTAIITPCEPNFSKGLSLFTLNREKGLKKYKEILNHVGFNVTRESIEVAYLADSFPTDTFNNEYGETFLDKFAQVASSGLGDIAQIAGWTNYTDAKEHMTNLGKAIPFGETAGAAVNKLMSMGSDSIAKMSPRNQKMLKGMGKTMQSLVTGARVDFPQVWKNSSFNPSYSMTIRLYNPNPANPASTRRYIVGPIAALVALAVPSVAEDSSTYKWPLLCKVRSKGIYHLNAAYINSIAIIKGGDQQSIAYNQNLAMCDVRIDFGSLYNSILAGGKSNKLSADRPTLGSYLEAIGGGSVTSAPTRRGVYKMTTKDAAKEKLPQKGKRKIIHNKTTPKVQDDSDRGTTSRVKKTVEDVSNTLSSNLPKN